MKCSISVDTLASIGITNKSILEIGININLIWVSPSCLPNGLALKP